MLLYVDAPQVQVIHMAQQNQPAILQGKIKKQGSGGNVAYTLYLSRKVRFYGPDCPHSFRQNWVGIFPDAHDNRYDYVHGMHSSPINDVHTYRVQLSCSMAGPIIERMQLQK